MDSLILNGNKIINKSRKIEDVLEEMRKIQNVPMEDLSLTEAFISKPILMKHEKKIDRFPIIPVLKKPIFHNDSKGFTCLPEKRVQDRIDYSIESDRIPENRSFVHKKSFFKTAKVIDCSDIYAMMQEQSIKNKLMFEKKLV